MASIDVLLADGQMVAQPYRNFDTVGDLLEQILITETPENRRRHALYEFRRAGDNIDIERPLESSTNLEQLKNEWAKDKYYTSCLKIVRLEHAVVVNYSVTFRMSRGMSESKTTFFVSDLTTVAQLLAEVKVHLKIPPNENKYGLMGYISGEKEMRRLSNDEKVHALKTAWDTVNTFFQFQVLPEAENQLLLGADKEGYSEQVSGVLVRKRWMSLRGTSLFLFKEKGENEVVLEIDMVHQRSISALGLSKKKGLGQKNTYRFDIEYDGKTENFFVEDEATMRSWVENLKQAGSRMDARAAQAIDLGSRERKLVQLGTKEAQVAAGHKVKEEEKVIPNSEKVIQLLDEVKKRGEAMVDKRDADSTKEMMSAIQNLLAKVASMIEPSFSEFKRNEIEKNSADAKRHMRDMISDCRDVLSDALGSVDGVIAVAQQTTSRSLPNIITPELRKLKSTIGQLFTACEKLAMCVNLDDADLRALLAPKPVATAQPKVAVKATGNAELDMAMNSMSMLGMDPEMVEMMRQAAAMSGETVSQQKAKQYAYYAGGGDHDLDNMLANLTSSLSGMDDGMPAAAVAAQPGGGEGKQSTATFGWATSWLPTWNYAAMNLAKDGPAVYGAPETCGACLLIIDSGVSIVLNKREYHQRCYTCVVCAAKFLPTEKVYETPKGLMCEIDYNGSLPPCQTCLRGVPEDDAVVANGRYFHRKCFKCLVCNKPVAGDLYDDKGVLQCENCYFKARDLICEECNKPLKGEFYMLQNRKRHIECFACSLCKKRTNEGNAKYVKNKLYCTNCSNKVFG